MSKSLRVLFTALLVGGLLSGASSLSAQNAVTTGQIRGRVTAEGSGVTGVSITAVNRETGLRRGALSDDEGFYAVRLLPPGEYTVRAEVIGYEPRIVEQVRVAIGQTATVNMELRTAAIALEGIEVVAERNRIDVTDAAVAENVTIEQIEELPALGRDFTDFIELSGQVAPDPGATTGGQFAIAGQRPSGTNLQIDGVDANNSFFGENRGGSRIPFVFSLESIREFQIITNGYDVEYGMYSGGIVNVVTRGGTNELEGTGYVNFRNDALTGEPFILDPDDAEIIRDYQVTQFAGRVSGPIIRDRAHFLLSFDGQRRREPQLPLTVSRFAPGGAEPNPALEAEVDQFLDILENQYGVEGAASGFRQFETTNDALTLFGRVDWSLNDAHRLTLRHNFSTYTNDNEWNGNFDFEYGVSRAERIEDVSHSFVGELQSVLGENMFNVFRFQWANEDRPRVGNDLRPTLTVVLSGSHVANNLVRYGGTFVGFNNLLEERKFQFIDNFTVARGDHTFKIGGTALLTRNFNRFQAPMADPFGDRQSAGEFIFDNLADFAAFRPSAYVRPMQQGGGIAADELNQVEWALYAQDEWRVSPRLTATLGVRYDQATFTTDPQPVVDVESAFGFETGFAPRDANNISPRFMLAYDLKGDGNSVIRAGAGYFYGRVPFVLAGNVLQTDVPVVELLCAGDPLAGDPDAPPSPADFDEWSPSGADNPEGCLGATAAGGLPSYSLWHEDFEYPETFKGNLGYETLLSDRLRLSTDLIYARTTSQYSVRNLNMRQAQFQLDNEDGRRVYTPAAIFTPGSANIPGSRVSTEFGDVFVNYNDGRAESWSGTAELSWAVSENTQLAASYTYTRAYDNISESCCTAGDIFQEATVGAFGPNELGGFGDFERGWGRSDFNRDHTVILSGFTELPFGFQLAGFWRFQSGRPWTPEVSGDINGDGVRFNDRPFVFDPDDLPLDPSTFGNDPEAEQRARYRRILQENDCVGEHQGQIIDRNTCNFPWSNRLDLRLSRRFETFGGQAAELEIDLFNVLNGVGQIFCSDEDRESDPVGGPCGWGRVTGIFAADRNLLFVRGFDSATNTILYGVPSTFGRESVLGANLLLQFQAQIGVRYTF